ncbi:MAG: metallophosphoesterase family protein [Candidatus Micrarchaeota archaeon]|nr:metallophosphoesterase family protein [Candidatus Micrarchaeota archaeon]
MRIAIIADLHLGYGRFYADSFEQARRALAEAVKRADLILVAGDIFDAKVPKMEVLSEAIRMFRSASGKRVPIAAIHGTHERRSRGSSNPVQLLAEAGLFTDVHNSSAIFELDGEKVAVHGMGGVPEQYVTNALEACSPKPVEGAFNIFMFHQNIRELVPAPDALGIEQLPPGFDLYVCGHMHARTVLEADGKLLLIPGSTVVTQMRGEEQGEKGFVMFDTKTRKHEFVPIKTRPFVMADIKFENAGISEIAQKCEKTISGIVGKNGPDMPAIRLVLGGSLSKGLMPSDVDVSHLAERSDAIVFIDKEFSSSDMQTAINKLRELRARKSSARELGAERLAEKLKAAGFKLEAEWILDALADGKGDEVVKMLSGKERSR